MARVIVMLACLVLAGCGPQPSDDGYIFEQKEWFRPGAPIVFRVHGSAEDLRRTAPASAKRDGYQLMAWSRISSAGCEVHVVDPAVVYAPEYIGHEITHCVYGRWHD